MVLSYIEIAGTRLPRHTLALINMAWAVNGWFWDGSSISLDLQAFAPFSAVDKMNQNLYERVPKRNAVPGFRKLCMVLVQQKCSGCHHTDLFTCNRYHNQGLDPDFPTTT